MSAIALIGHNNPPEPTPIERAQDAMGTLAAFLNETPVITDGPHLVEAKRLVEYARGAMAELETERDQLVRPLNDQVTSINLRYKAIHNTDGKKPGTFDKVLIELKARLTAYAREEEARRELAAEQARLAAEAAEAAAREAERIEQQTKADASTGVLDANVVEAIADADQKFSEFEQASRFAARAEKETTFRIGDGRNKALSMRTEKTLVLEHYGKAIKAIGPNDKIRDAILSAARDYRKLRGKLPDGVTETSERKF
jgi:hypothetical protein